MPLPLPDLADECDGMPARETENLACRELERRGVEEQGAQVDEGDEQNEL